MNEKVLVTGANGLLGANIVKQLPLQKYDVKIIVRENSNLKGIDGLTYEKVIGDICKYEDLERAIKDCSYVIHVAANTSQGDSFDNYFRVNVEVTKNIIALCKKHKIKRLVYISTTNCFTNGSKEKPGVESSGFMPWLKGSGYAYSKHLAQELVQSEIHHNKFPAIILAPTFMLGARDAKVSSGQLLLYALKKRIVFCPPGGKSFVDVEHVAEAAINSLYMGNLGESYILSGSNLTYKEAFKMIRKTAKRRQLLLPIPRFILITASSIILLINRIFGTDILFTPTNQKLLCLDNYFSANKAAKELGFKTTNAELAVSNAINWFKDNSYI
ncbi:MAG: NAD-dependent epimerase/dehydratase family protein [Hyphomicrobiales bacterium]